MLYMSYLYTHCIFFFFMITLPSRSTLFPYTTLFRSRLYEEGNGIEINFSTAMKLYDKVLKKDRNNTEAGMGLFKMAAAIAKDRKSTRLNSSHLGNSYAVFCLKKKIIRSYCVAFYDAH